VCEEGLYKGLYADEGIKGLALFQRCGVVKGGAYWRVLGACVYACMYVYVCVDSKGGLGHLLGRIEETIPIFFAFIPSWTLIML
jgi:hypothetical protein